MTNSSPLDRNAHELRRAELKLLAGQFSNWLSTGLQSRHEARLRRQRQPARLRPVIPMPA